MLFRDCKLTPVDNSGIKLVKCVKLISKTKKYASVGDLLGVVIKRYRLKKKLTKKTIYYGLIISTKSPIIRLDGIKLKSVNRIVLMTTKLQILSSRIKGPIYKEIRNNFIGKGRYRRWKYDKVVSFAKKVI